MAILFTNNASAKLASAASTSGTTITIETGKGALFPSVTWPDYFLVTLVRASDSALEIVQCTSRVGDSLTVVRAQEGTAAIAFSAGDKCELRITAGALNEAFVQKDVSNGFTKKQSFENPAGISIKTNNIVEKMLYGWSPTAIGSTFDFYVLEHSVVYANLGSTSDFTVNLTGFDGPGGSLNGNLLVGECVSATLILPHSSTVYVATPIVDGSAATVIFQEGTSISKGTVTNKTDIYSFLITKLASGFTVFVSVTRFG